MSNLISILTCGLISSNSNSKKTKDANNHQLTNRNLRGNRRNGSPSPQRKSHHLPRLTHFRHNNSASDSDTNVHDGINTMDDYRIHDSDVAVTRSIASSHLEQMNTTPTVYRVTDHNDTHFRVNKNKEDGNEIDGDDDHMAHIQEGEGANNVEDDGENAGDTFGGIPDDYSTSDFSVQRVDDKGRPIAPVIDQRPANYAIVLDGSLSPGFVPAVQ